MLIICAAADRKCQGGAQRLPAIPGLTSSEAILSSITRTISSAPTP